MARITGRAGLAERGSVDTTRGAGGETRYRLRHGSFARHLTCRVCGRSVEVDRREVWEWARQVAFLAEITLTGHTVELAGVCPAHAGGSSGFSGVPDRVQHDVSDVAG